MPNFFGPTMRAFPVKRHLILRSISTAPYFGSYFVLSMARNLRSCAQVQRMAMRLVWEGGGGGF